MTILVTGGAGFIGSEFVRFWLDTRPDSRVVVLDALTYSGRPENIPQDTRVAFYHGRIEDSGFVDQLFADERPAYVMNFAAETHNDRSLLDPGSPILTNVLGVNVLLEACRKHGIERFLQVSTDEVYGEIGAGAFKETDPLEPRTPYSAGKAGGEMQVRAHRIAFGTPTVVTRGSNTIGPRQYPEKLLPFFITRALQDKRVPVYGAGNQVRDYIHVRDHCTGIATVLDKGALGEAYNVGGGNERTNIEVTRRLLQLLGKPESLIKHIEDPRGEAHDKRYALDTTKIRALGWRPQIGFDDAIESTVRWYVDNQDWWQPILDDHGYQDYVRRFYGKYLGDDL